ncbi:hypothetical protein B0H14DRAFT_3498928 [Mycena olivaceomarginata]|nr:hypothetical protein B0H14DRAFT_3498928 [Mycena olivaceomarginata]
MLRSYFPGLLLSISLSAAQVIFDGNWANHVQAPYGCGQLTQTAGSSIVLKFSGTYITVKGPPPANPATIAATLDGAPSSLNSSGTDCMAFLYQTTALPLGSHILNLTFVGPASNNKTFLSITSWAQRKSLRCFSPQHFNGCSLRHLKGSKSLRHFNCRGSFRYFNRHECFSGSGFPQHFNGRSLRHLKGSKSLQHFNCRGSFRYFNRHKRLWRSNSPEYLQRFNRLGPLPPYNRHESLRNLTERQSRRRFNRRESLLRSNWRGSLQHFDWHESFAHLNGLESPRPINGRE